MKSQTTTILRCLFFIMLPLTFVSAAQAVPTFRVASGPNPAAIQFAVDQFRADLGPMNPNTAQTFTGGRREITWDDVPNSASLPNFFAGTFFNLNSPRGVVLGAPASNVGSQAANFQISANTASGTPVRFGNIEPSYANNFQTFSGEKLFSVRSTSTNSNIISIQFFIPGTNVPAGVSGFGVVLCDVDLGPNTMIRLYGADGQVLTPPASAQQFNNGLSFFGATFTDGTKIARVELLFGNAPLKAGNIDGVNGLDLIAMDNLIYGEPHALTSHSSDYDGDGATDVAIFRPGIGFWTIIMSGTDSFTTVNNFGQVGDIPIDGDFDGDAKTDLAVFRPSTGTWVIKESHSGLIVNTQFGTQSDRPVPGDYDKDGKTDLAVFRPPIGAWLILRSSDGSVMQKNAGLNFDIPIPASPQ